MVSLRRVILRVKLLGLQPPCTSEFGPEFDAASYKRKLYARAIERRKNYSNRSSITGVTRGERLRGHFSLRKKKSLSRALSESPLRPFSFTRYLSARLFYAATTPLYIFIKKSISRSNRHLFLFF